MSDDDYRAIFRNIQTTREIDRNTPLVDESRFGDVCVLIAALIIAIVLIAGQA